MNLLLLGRGKTGSLVLDFAVERKHRVRLLGSAENRDARGLTPEALKDVDVVIDFTTPEAVLKNIEACVTHGKNMVVGTTGWYGEIAQVRGLVEQHSTGFVYAANFSFGVNLFFEVAQLAGEAVKHGYGGAIEEVHHVHKKDAPSGTALKIQQIIEKVSGKKLGIASIRESDVPGTHTISLESDADSLTFTHTAKSRRAFTEGAVKAAEWVRGRKGFYDFRDIFHEVE